MAGSGVATGPNSISGMLNDPMLTLVLANVTLLNGVVDTIPSNTNELVSNAMLSVLTLPTDAVSIKLAGILIHVEKHAGVQYRRRKRNGDVIAPEEEICAVTLLTAETEAAEELVKLSVMTPPSKGGESIVSQSKSYTSKC